MPWANSVPIGSGRLPLGQRRRPVRAQARLRERGQLRGQLLGRRPRLAGRHHPVREPDRQRLVRLDRAAGEDQVQRPALPDQPRQPHGAAVDQRHAPAPAEHPEHRRRVRHPQVAPQRQLQPAGHRVPADRRDHRLRQHHARRAHRAVAVRDRPVSSIGADRLEIRARAERRSHAGEHRDRRRVVRVERAERVRERGRGGPVDRVARLGTVDAAPWSPARRVQHGQSRSWRVSSLIG